MLGRESKTDIRGTDGVRQNGLPSGTPGRFPSGSSFGQSLSAPDTGATPMATSILGPDISIIGQQLVLKTKGSLLIQGQIQGDVHGEAVTVDNGAKVTGIITARTIAVLGDVTGSLKGSNVILHASSHVEANIVHYRLSISDGAHFEGSVQRARENSEVEPDLT